MAQAFEWTDTQGASTGCPVHGGSFAEQPPAQDRVDWAGLPINLDFAFSREQRDKVYAQHLMRRAQFSRRPHDGMPRCSCDGSTDLL
ncbi:hypothetical protein [Mycobacterium rhizamassiliense]|uniref:hypothetical protein n=1 Tax=Mycobacterium rhizamassiliense TaxID=1841860 RepID=UPI0012FFCB3C|nr:hypothetical protein [Mycobacterium rhizamassiliense]